LTLFTLVNASGERKKTTNAKAKMTPNVCRTSAEWSHVAEPNIRPNFGICRTSAHLY